MQIYFSSPSSALLASCVWYILARYPTDLAFILGLKWGLWSMRLN